MSALTRTPRVEILGFESCPNLAPTRALVEQIARELAIEPVLEIVDVPDADAAARLRFLGSPTVRVDGVDVEPGAGARSEHVVSCRLYRTRDGFARLPSETWLRDALRRSAAPEEPVVGDTVGFGQVLGARA